MKCILAIPMFLANAKIFKNRLVITSGDLSNSYSTYGIPEREKLPVFQRGSKIYQTIPPHTNQGMKVTVYCSFSPEINIERELTRKLQNLSKMAHIDSYGVLMGETECLKRIELHTFRKFKPKSVSALVNEPPCSYSKIINLAHRNQIGMKGPYSNLAPAASNNVRVVRMDKPIPVREVIHDGLYLVETTATYQLALAWYFGFLHLFRRNSYSNQWYPLTKIGLERENGKTLYAIIMKNIFPGILNIKKNIPSQKAELGQGQDLMSGYAETEGKRITEMPSKSLVWLHANGELGIYGTTKMGKII
ncbi:BgTH12-05945 [Blumeria graminis f. sp. triticale]|uniref:BgTH12-05945 n=1 Tax=Blumeria graminis f. sp. triticale TaxID=1689686 RepID=A0A9W4D500_BLUGR|nr:BgTH12-05945 [Blumeria graminis f. sp. triticale]